MSRCKEIRNVLSVKDANNWRTGFMDTVKPHSVHVDLFAGACLEVGRKTIFSAKLGTVTQEGKVTSSLDRIDINIYLPDKYMWIYIHGRRGRGKEDEEWRGVPSQGSNIHNFEPAVPPLLSQASQIAVQHRLCLTQTSTLHLEAKHDRKKSNNISTTSPPPPMASLPAGNLNSSWLATQPRDSQRVCLRKKGEHTSRTLPRA